MQTKTIEVYEFKELTEKAKEKAIQEYRDKNHTFFWNDEYKNSLNEFEKHWPIKINNYEISAYCHCFIDWEYTGDEQHGELSGLKLAKHLWNEYEHVLFEGKYYGKLVDHEKDGKKIEKSKEHPAGVRHVKRYSKVIKEPRMLTGYYADYELTDRLHKALDGKYKGTFQELLGECIEQFKTAWQKDMEYQDSDEFITEQMECNEYRFLIDGTHYRD